MELDIFERAVIYATKAHAGTKRKGGDLPYITHPLEAAAIAASITSDRELLAAAVLHDVVEDTPYTEADIRCEFGDRVASLVASESEDKREDLPPSETWKLRKRETLDALEKAGRDEKLIALADKLSNIRAMSRDFDAIGDKLWERFNQKNKSEHGWYYLGIAERMTEFKDTAAYKEYVALCKKVFGDA